VEDGASRLLARVTRTVAEKEAAAAGAGTLATQLGGKGLLDD
jgi:hypothetical protein